MTDHSSSGFRRISAIPPEMRAGSTKAPRPIRLRGMVRSGVERGSVVLLGPSGQLLAQLMGGDPAVLADGRTVAVTGHFVEDRLTTTQQGMPFQVLEAVIETGPQDGG